MDPESRPVHFCTVKCFEHTLELYKSETVLGEFTCIITLTEPREDLAEYTITFSREALQEMFNDSESRSMYVKRLAKAVKKEAVGIYSNFCVEQLRNSHHVPN